MKREEKLKRKLEKKLIKQLKKSETVEVEVVEEKKEIKNISNKLSSF